MPAPFPIQTSFAAGEISPRLTGHTDAPGYKAGLASCLNFNPTPQGSLLKPEGLILVDAPTDAAGFQRLIPFKSSDLTRVQISLTDGRLRVFSGSGVLGAFTTEYIVNGGCYEGGGGWTFSSSSYVRTGYYGYSPDQWIELVDPGSACWAKQTITSLPAGTYSLKFRGRNAPGNGGSNLGDYALSGRIDVTIGTTDNGSQIAAQSFSGTGDFSINFTIGSPTTIYLKFTHPTGNSQYAAFDDISVRLQSGTMYAAAPWLAADISQVQYVAETGRDRMIFVHPWYEPRVLSRDKTTGIWALQRMFTDLGGVKPTKGPAHTPGDYEWTGTGNPSPAVGGNGDWPSVVGYWQGRIYMAACPSKRNTFWASKPFGYDFSAANYAALTAGDGFSYDAAVKGEIRWFQGQKVLLCGTDDGEFSISASDGVVYAGNIDIKQESAFGSAAIQAIAVGDQVLFVSPDRKKLRAMSFSLEGGGWYSKDITFSADHITKPTIVDMAFARDPFNTIVLCLDNGTLACCNYDRGEKVTGWWRRQFTGALAKSVSVMTRPEGDEIWVVADLPSAQVRFLARWPLFETSKPKLDLQRTLNCEVTTETGTLALTNATKVVTASSALVFAPATGLACIGTIIRILGPDWYGEIRITAILGTYTARFEVVNEWGLTGDVPATALWNFSTAILRFGGNWWNGIGMYTYPLCANPGQVVIMDDATNERVVPYGSTALDLYNPTDGYSVAVQNTAPDGVTLQTVRTYTVGFAFTATAETLPLEGGNPAGSAQGMNIHRADITARLNDSCLPQVNGATVEPPTNRFRGVGADPLLYLRMAGDRFTDDATAKPQSRNNGGIVTITQELPWRTEVCALFGNVQMSKV